MNLSLLPRHESSRPLLVFCGQQAVNLPEHARGWASLIMGGTHTGVLKRSVHLCESIIKNFIPSQNATTIVGFLSFWNLWRTHKRTVLSK